MSDGHNQLLTCRVFTCTNVTFSSVVDVCSYRSFYLTGDQWNWSWSFCCWNWQCWQSNSICTGEPHILTYCCAL